MEATPEMQQEQVRNEGLNDGLHGDAHASRTPEEHNADENADCFSKEEARAGDSPGAHATVSQVPTGEAETKAATTGQGRVLQGPPTDIPEACGTSTGCPADSGTHAGSQTPVNSAGGPNPGLGPQPMGSFSEPELQHGYSMHNPGPYGHPGYGAPTGAPQPRHHPGPGHHPWCYSRHDGMYGAPPRPPHFPPPQGPGFGHAGIPHQEYGADHHHGPFADMVGKALQGQATPQDLVTGLLNLNFRDDQFWKGVVLGSVAALLFHSGAVRQTLAGVLTSVLGKPEEKP